VQVSLLSSESPHDHYALGRAVSALREEGVVIIGAGMSVHNLREMGWGEMKPKPWAVSFDEALRDAVTVRPEEREEFMEQVVRRPDARRAHPSMDHLMPVYVAAGAAEKEVGRQIWTLQEGSFAWAQYRFGEVPEDE
jgi:aromatic ring-opening dioxygenase catalytic subunit (LigB family)